MPLPVPNLDDRTFEQLVTEGRSLIPRYTKEWTNHNTADPGITLVELFAWLNENAQFQLDQVPPLTVEHSLKLLDICRAGPIARKEAIDLPLKRALEAQSKVTRALTKDDFRTWVERAALDGTPVVSADTGARTFAAASIAEGANLQQIEVKENPFRVGERLHLGLGGNKIGVEVHGISSSAPLTLQVGGYTELAAEDFKQVEPFIAQLQADSDPLTLPVSTFVWSQIPPATQAVLIDPTTPSETKLTFLVAALNVVLRGNLLYLPARFAGVPLSVETTGYITLIPPPQGARLVRLNRLLLEDTYPESLHRSPKQPYFTRIDYPKGEALGRFDFMLHADKLCAAPEHPEEAPIVALIIVVPKQPDPPVPQPQPTPGLIELLFHQLRRHRLVTTRVRVIGPKYITVDVDAKVDRKPGSGLTTEAVAQIIRAFLDPLTGGLDGNGWPFGRAVYYSELY